MKSKILEHNQEQFLKDIKSVREVLVYSNDSRAFLKVRKLEVMREAEDRKIYYFMSDTIFVSKRMTMVIT